MPFPLVAPGFLDDVNIEFVAAATNSNAGNAALTITLPAGTTTGDVVLVMFDDRQGANVAISTSGYTLLYNLADVKIAYKVMGSTPDTTVTRGSNGVAGRAQTGIAFVFRNVSQSNPSDATPPSTATGTSTTPDSPSITTVTPGAVVVSAFVSNTTDAAVTGPSGYSDATSRTHDTTIDGVIGMAWKRVDTPGAENPPSWSNVVSASWGALTVALRRA